MWSIINYRDLILEYSSAVLLIRKLFKATSEHLSASAFNVSEVNEISQFKDASREIAMV